MPLLNALQPVAAPALAVPVRSLLQAVTVLRDSTLNPVDRWEIGATWQTRRSAQITGPFDPCGVPTATPAPVGPVLGSASPFGIRLDDSCSTLSTAHDLAERTEQIADQLELARSYQIAKEFWNGTAAAANTWANPYLSKTSLHTLLNSGTAYPYVTALGEIQQAFATKYTGERAYIHAPFRVVNAWAEANIIWRDGPQLRDYIGNLIVTDAGYDGSGPSPTHTAATIDATWVYATPPVEVYLSPQRIYPDAADLSSSIVRTTNDWTMYADQLAVVVVDLKATGIIAVTVDTNTRL